MSKVEVLNLLGPPTWAVIPSDTGDFKIVIPQVAYDLYWKNEDCPPVLVKFDASNQVYGYDDGRDMCGKGANRFEPTSAYTCNKPDRAAYCE